jgi:glycosyltransferase involved in cell wall biosynthesis
MFMKLHNHPQEDKHKIRILIIAPSLRILGGQAIQAKHLITHLADEPGFEVSFLPHNPRLKGPLGLLQSIKYIRTIVTSIVYCLTLMVRIPRYDVIHIFSASYFSFLLAPTPAILISKWFAKKTILNYHSGEAEDHLRMWPRTAFPILKMADKLVVPSQYLVEVFRKFGLRAHAVANVIDVESFKFRERRPLLPRFLTNRNLYPLYNVACVLRAFGIIQQKFPDATLTVAGDGDQRVFLRGLAKQLKLRNVEFLGHVAPEKMSELYAEAHIFLNGSNIDNLPGSILDSFASGVPVVTTCAGGIPYIVTHEETGLLVPRNDAAAMAASAVRLLESPDFAARIAQNAREECREYTWRAVRRMWVTLYSQMAEQNVGVEAHIDQVGQASPLQ